MIIHLDLLLSDCLRLYEGLNTSVHCASVVVVFLKPEFCIWIVKMKIIRDCLFAVLKNAYFRFSLDG